MPTAAEITRHEYPEPDDRRSAWVAGHGPSVGIELVPPDPGWPAAYELLARRVRSALEGRVLALDHVGSTAVPGLAAKPVIDIDLTVADSAEEAAWLPDLKRAGFELVIREPWWHEHRMLTTETPFCQLHVFGPTAPEPIRHVMFRDWLRTHPDELVLYQSTKLAAAEASNLAGEHGVDYNLRKQAVIHEIYDRAFRAAGLL